jgi:hypothetical protein
LNRPALASRASDIAAALVPRPVVKSPPMAPGIGGPNIEPPPQRESTLVRRCSMASSIATTEKIARSLRNPKPLADIVVPAATTVDAQTTPPPRAMGLSIFVLLLVFAIAAMLAVFDPTILTTIDW